MLEMTQTRQSSQGRLQRPADFTGSRLTTFRAVVLRHGLPGLLLGLACFAYPQTYTLLLNLTAAGSAQGLRYMLGFLALLVGLSVFSYVRYRDLNTQQLRWIVYLGALSAWEEWAFRAALPFILADTHLSLTSAVLLSNLLFGLMHYFTLRWRWQWCVGACIGGLALSRQLHLHDDLLSLIGIHWLATFINTPRPPERRA